MKPTLKQVLATVTPNSVHCDNYNKLDLGIPEDGIADQSAKKYGFPRQGVFSHLLSLNSVVYFKTPS
jgi:hypothetical protein